MLSNKPEIVTINIILGRDSLEQHIRIIFVDTLFSVQNCIYILFNFLISLSVFFVVFFYSLYI